MSVNWRIFPNSGNPTTLFCVVIGRGSPLTSFFHWLDKLSTGRKNPKLDYIDESKYLQIVNRIEIEFEISMRKNTGCPIEFEQIPAAFLLKFECYRLLNVFANEDIGRPSTDELSPPQDTAQASKVKHRIPFCPSFESSNIESLLTPSFHLIAPIRAILLQRRPSQFAATFTTVVIIFMVIHLFRLNIFSSACLLTAAAATTAALTLLLFIHIATTSSQYRH